MTKSKKETGVDRRRLLTALGNGAVGTAVIATGATVAANPAQATESVTERVKKRYRETDHVKAYYRTNRY